MTISDYLLCLEKEYVSARIRSRIQKRDKDREFFATLAENKRRKIVNISTKHDLPTMFDNTEKELSRYDEIQGNGFPDFSYTPYEISIGLPKKDFIQYFTIGSEVEIVIDFQTTASAVVTAIHYKKKLISTTHGNFDHKQVRRIFSENSTHC